MKASRVVLGLGVVALMAACEEGAETDVLGPSSVGLSVTVSPRVDTIFAADTVRATDVTQLVATVRSAATGGPVTGTDVSFQSSDTTIATVSSTGLVQARGFGEVTISVDIPGKKGVTAVVVVAQRTSSVRITPGADTVFVDDPIVARDTVRLRAQATDRTGAIVPGTRFIWRSSATGVATVDSAGVVRGVNLGTTTITATGGGIAANAVVHVSPLVKSVSVTASATQALVSDTIQLTARATGQNDQVLAGRRYSWQSETPGVASVDSTGRVIVLTPGTTRLRATTGFVSSTVTVEVQPRALAMLDVGDDFTCSVANLGRGYCWGSDSIPERLGVVPDSLCFPQGAPESFGCTISPLRFGAGVTLSAVSAGGTSACGLSGETVYCWGNNEFGQRGDGQRGTSVSGLVRATVSNIRFKSVTVGGLHACALSTTDTAYCWGADGSGQLGDGRRINSTTPIPLAVTFENTRWSRLSAGDAHSCGITTAGTAYCWGSNGGGQLGIGSTILDSETPLIVVGGLAFTEISAGGRHTCAVSVGGALYCWGANDSLQLGTPSTNPPAPPAPTLVPGISNVVQLSAGTNHTCALVQGGQVYCWGSASWGQVGNGQPSGIVASPALVSAAAPFRSVSAGKRHSCGIDVNNVAYCWGSNVFGSLGNELQAALRATPQRVATPR